MRLLIFLAVEILTFVAIREYFYDRSRTKYFFFSISNSILTVWLWILFFEYLLYRGIFDMPEYSWLMMALTGVICAVVIPRIIFIVFHYSGKIYRRKTGGYVRSLTNTGLAVSFVIFSIVTFGTLFGRFNFKTEEATIRIKGLKKDLDGLRIVHLSDMHLTSFYHHHDLLQDVMEKVNSYNPDLIINTGDFVNYGWREFNSFDTILRKAESRLGNYAVLGNHDFGTYHPDYTEADREHNVLIMNNLIESSGYRVLNNEFTVINEGDAKIALIGVTTMGQVPDIIYGDLEKAVRGLDSADLKILLMHDPNQWEKDVIGKTDITVTLAGHTHGMQMGIVMKKFRWSPSKFFYTYWNGLYSQGDQYLYVNRGLGVLAIPFRIWMPPEITIINIVQK